MAPRWTEPPSPSPGGNLEAGLVAEGGGVEGVAGQGGGGGPAEVLGRPGHRPRLPQHLAEGTAMGWRGRGVALEPTPTDREPVPFSSRFMRDGRRCLFPGQKPMGRQISEAPKGQEPAATR